MKAKISLRQTGILTVMCILANKLLLLPSLLFERTGVDGLISVAISFAVELILIPIFLKLKTKHPSLSFYEILKKYFGVIAVKTIFFALLVFMFMKAILTFGIVYVYFKQEIYQEEFLMLILVCMLPVLTHGVLSGLRTISRTMEFFFTVVLVGFFVCLLMSLFTSVTLPVFFVNSAGTIFSSAFKYFIVFDDFLFLFIIMDRVDIKQGQEKKFYFYVLLGMFMVLAMFFFFYAKYPVTAFMHDNALSDLLVFSVQFSAIGRLNIIAMITIMLITLFQMEIFCFGFCQCFENLLPKLNKKHAIALFDIVLSLIFLLFVGSHADIVEAAEGWFSIFAIGVFVVVFIVSLILCFVRRKDEEKD
ncbi:MAG: GerAB/ArcD/ProY family transporter [Clostridia bacterium]|nr:GerAB/ArcD/ProY family transporter [Clostridia bacterium]